MLIEYHEVRQHAAVMQQLVRYSALVNEMLHIVDIHVCLLTGGDAQVE